jgi:hypothetical protein
MEHLEPRLALQGDALALAGENPHDTDDLASNLVAAATQYQLSPTDPAVISAYTGTLPKTYTMPSGPTVTFVAGQMDTFYQRFSNGGSYRTGIFTFSFTGHSISQLKVNWVTNGGPGIRIDFGTDGNPYTGTVVDTYSTSTYSYGQYTTLNLPSGSSPYNWMRWWSPVNGGLTNVTFVASANPPANTIGLYDRTTGAFYLRNSNSSGNADNSFRYGPPNSNWQAIAGDWDGDGIDTIGLYNPTAGTFYLRNSNSSGNANISFTYGPGGQGWQPIAGDWSGNGTDTIGLYDPSTSTFYLRNSNSPGPADLKFVYGPGGSGWLPITGEWAGGGTDTIGLYDPSASAFYLRNSNSSGNADISFGYGPAGGGWAPITGNWTGYGTDTIGLYAPPSSVFYLRNTNSSGPTNTSFGFGPAGAGWQPISGVWVHYAALTAADDEATAADDLAPLDAALVEPLVADAIADWASVGLAADRIESLLKIDFVVVDLPGPMLGMALRDTIYLDVDAAGHGWFADPTPGADEEFVAIDGVLRAVDPSAVDRIDLATVVSHELGHALGLDDVAPSMETLMSGLLETGTRRVPGVEAIDAVFAA